MAKSQNTLRIRQNNFTSYEIELLKEIFADENKLKVIECKSTDKYTKLQKDRVWEQITHEFCNDINTNKRGIKSIKGFWKRYKIECRKNCNKGKSAIRATGGGPQPEKCQQLDGFYSNS